MKIAKRIVSAILAIVMVFGMLPMPAFAMELEAVNVPAETVPVMTEPVPAETTAVPVTEAAEPVAETAEAPAETTVPVTEETEAAEPETEPTEAAEVPAAPATEATEPVAETTEPSTGATEPTETATEPTEEPTEATTAPEETAETLPEAEKEVHTITFPAMQATSRDNGMLYSQPAVYQLTLSTYSKVTIDYASTSPNNTDFTLYQTDPWKKVTETYYMRNYFEGDYQYGRYRTYELPAGEYELRIFPDTKLDVASAYWVEVTVKELSHTCSYTYKTYDPTCTKQGYSVGTCSLCGDKYTTSYKDPLGHDAVVIEAVPTTCAAPGATEGTKCVRCKAILTEPKVIPALPHTPVSAPSREATCTDPGMTNLKVCDVCEAVVSFTETAPALGHDFVQFVCTRCDIVDENEIWAHGFCGDNVRWLVDNNCDMYLVGSGPMYDYSETDYVDYRWTRDFNSITIGDGITSIGNNAFCFSDINKSYVDWVKIPDSVTRIGNQAFELCDELLEIDIPGSVRTIGDEAFRDCDMLTSVVIPEGVRSLGARVFYNCSNLEEVVIADSVTDIGVALFSKCFCIESITIGDGVEVIPASCFYNVGGDVRTSGNAKITLGSGVKTISEKAFTECTLQSLVVPEGCTTIEEMAFYNAWKLTTITLPDSLEIVGDNAFYGTALETVYYGGTSSDWNKVAIGTDSYLKYATVHYTNSHSLGDLSWKLFQGTLTISGTGAIPDYSATTHAPWYSSRSSIQKVVIGEGVTGIGDYAFDGLSNVTEIRFEGDAPTFGGSHVFAGVTAKASYAFDKQNWTGEVMQNYGGSITWKLLPAKIVSSGSCGDNLFWELDEAGTLTISGSGAMYDYNDGEAYSAPFWGTVASKIVNVVIGDNVTSIDEWAFSGCSKLQSITIPDSVTSIGKYAFKNCTALTEINLPSTVTKLGEGVFYGCYKLTKIAIPQGTAVIPAKAFMNCEALTTVTLHDRITEIGNEAFCFCPLTELTLPDSLKTIGEDAFVWAEIPQLTFGANISSIGAGAFAGCDYLAELRFYGDKPTISGTAFDDITATAYYPMDNATWTASALKGYGGTLKWIAFDLTVVEEGSCGAGLSWTINTAGVLRIFGTGSMYAYNDSDNPAPWKTLGRKAHSLVIEDGVTGISDHAFCGMTGLTEVTAKSVKTIGAEAFAGCTALETMVLPETLETIGPNALATQSDLTITYAGTMQQWHGLNPGGNMPADCADGRYLTGGSLGTSAYYMLSNGNTLTVWGKGMAEAEAEDLLEYCDSIRYLVIDEGVTDFLGFPKLPKVGQITIPSTLERCDVGFAADGILEKIHISDFAAWCGIEFVAENDTQVPSLLSSGAKLYMDGGLLTDVVLPNSVTEITDYMFYGAAQLKSITLPATVTHVSATAFEGCSSKLKVIFEGTMDQWIAVSEASVTATCSDGTLMGHGVCGEDLTWKLLGDGTLLISGQGAMYDFVSSGEATDTHRLQPWKNVAGEIEKLVIEEGVTSVGERAFYSCSDLKEATLPEGLTRIGPAAFHSCMRLKTLRLPASLQSIGHSAFSVCYSMTDVIIPDIDAWCAIEFGDEYSNPLLNAMGLYLNTGDEKVTSFTAPSVIRNYAFYGYDSLEEVIIPEGASIGYAAFEYCGDLTIRYQGDFASWEKVDYSGAVTTICNDGTTILGRGLCDPDNPNDSDPFNENIRWIVSGDGALRIYGSGELTIPGNYEAPWRALCNQIVSIEIEDGITSIPEGAFSNAVYSNLKTIVIGTDVETIHNNAFGSGEHAKTIIFRNHPKRINPDNFQNETAWVYYRPADGWTEAELGQYNAKNLYWIPYEAEEDIEKGGPIRILADTTHVASGKYVDLRYDLFGQSGYKLKWMVDDTTAATVNNNGRITAKNVTGLKQVTVTLMAYPSQYGNVNIPNNAENPEDYLPEGSMYNKMILFVHPKAKAVQIFDNAGFDRTGKTSDLDIVTESTAELTFKAVTLDEDALDVITWNTSDKAQKFADYEIDSKNNTIKVKNPRNVGTVTLTAAAADGSGKSAVVKVNIVYVDASRTLTARTDVPAIGLQPEAKATMMVFGTDKEIPLAAEHITFTSSNEYIATVAADGTITGGDKTGTASITAAINGDPLKRKVSVNVKVIVPQTDAMVLRPGNLSEPMNCEMWDSAGNLTEDVSQAVRYALYLDKDTFQDRKFTLQPEAQDYRGQALTLTKASLRWESSDTRVASLTTNTDGSVTVTVKKNADGACAITATSTDLAKKEAEFMLYVRDYSPRLESSNLTLNSFLGTGVSTGFVESYGNHVALDDYGAPRMTLYEYDARTKSYQESTRLFPGFSEDILTITNTEEIKSAVQLRLEVTCENGQTYLYDLKLSVKNTAPAITIRQLDKINTFLRSSTARLQITAKDTAVTDVQIYDDPNQAEHYALTWEEEAGTYALCFSEEYLADTSVKLNNRITLLVSLEGYLVPVSKVINVAANTVKPNLSLSIGSSIINTALHADPTTAFHVYDKTSKSNLPLYDWEYQIETSEDVVWDIMEDHRLQLTLLGEKSVNVKISVQHMDWTQSITLNHRINVQNKLPTVRLANGSLRLNAVYYEEAALTAVTLDQANLRLADIRFESTEKEESEAWYDAQKLSVYFDSETAVISAAILGADLPKNRTYTYRYVPVLEDGTELKAGTFKVTVYTQYPAVKLKSNNLLLNTIFFDEMANTTVSLGNPLSQNTGLAEIVNFQSTAKEGSDAYLQAEKLYLYYEEGCIYAQFANTVDMPKNGSYTFRYTPVLSNGTELPAGTIRVTVQTKAPTVKLQSTTLKMNTVYAMEGESTAVTLSQSPVGLLDFVFENTHKEGTDAYYQAEKLYLYYDNGEVRAEFLSTEDLPKPGTYTFRYIPVLENGKELAAGTIRITVHTTLPTMKLVNANLKLNSIFSQQTGSTAFTLSDTRLWLGDDSFVTTAKVNTAAYAEAQKIRFTRDGDTIIVRFADPADPAKPGTYTFQYTPSLESGIALKPVTIRVSVSNTVPRVSFASGILRLNQFLVGFETAATQVRLTNGSGYALAGFAELTAGSWTDVGNGMELSYDAENQQVLARLQTAAAVRTGVKLTPILIDTATGQNVTMPSTVTLNLQVYNNSRITVNFSTKGKLDLMDPGSAIVYTVNSIGNAAGKVEDFWLAGADADKFEAVLDLSGAKPVVTLKLKDGESYATNTTYKVQLVFVVCGQEVYSQVLNIRVNQTGLRFSTTPKTILYYQSQSGPVKAAVSLTSPTTVTLEDARITVNETRTTKALLQALGGNDVQVKLNEAGRNAAITLSIRNAGRLVHGRNYTLVLDITPANNAENLKPTQVNLTLRVMK